jgi:thymidylate synthase
MLGINARNVNTALEDGLNILEQHGIKSDSRNGAVLVAPWPMITVTRNPTERVLFSGLRDANPFFHLAEAFWMLAGANDTQSLTRFVPRMADFSDDGKTLNGAYGHRWRWHFGNDQLMTAIQELRNNPSSRRVVLAMWDGGTKIKVFDEDTGCESAYAEIGDLDKAIKGSKDVPCNTHIYFDANKAGLLDMTVCCRSNDAVWGAHGANAVHFSVLHEFVARAAKLPLGKMYQFSNNYHIYTDRPDVQRLLGKDGYVADDMYAAMQVEPWPLLATQEEWRYFLKDCEVMARLLRYGSPEYCDPETYDTIFFRKVFAPMFRYYENFKATNLADAPPKGGGELNLSVDWHRAAYQWVQRRVDKAGAQV